MLQSLKVLPCFNHISLIKPIMAGLSSSCYQVQADNKYFFAKQVNTKNESIVCLQGAKMNISPKVVYHDQHWLITQFIDGKDLSVYQASLDEKIKIATSLMAQCHKIDTQPIVFEAKTITDELIDKMQMSELNKDQLRHLATQLIPKLIPSIENPTNLVCCHGDVNFSNILISSTNKAYLVDFECTCTAPAEYDLAMFIAVNNLTKDKISTIIAHYTKSTSINVDLILLNQYIDFCYFINSLWYLDYYNNVKSNKAQSANFLSLAKQQWAKLTLNQPVPSFVVLK